MVHCLFSVLVVLTQRPGQLEGRPQLGLPMASLIHTCHHTCTTVSSGVPSTAGAGGVLHGVLHAVHLIGERVCLLFEVSLSGFGTVSRCAPNVLKLAV